MTDFFITVKNTFKRMVDTHGELHVGAELEELTVVNTESSECDEYSRLYTTVVRIDHGKGLPSYYSFAYVLDNEYRELVSNEIIDMLEVEPVEVLVTKYEPKR